MRYILGNSENASWHGLALYRRTRAVSIGTYGMNPVKVLPLLFIPLFFYSPAVTVAFATILFFLLGIRFLLP